MKKKRTSWTLALLLGAASVPAQEWGPTPDTGITQTVARISYIEGNVSYARGDEPDQWQGADQNVPMTTGDRLYTDQGSLELQLEGGSAVELGPQTDLTALNLGQDIQQFAVKSGSSAFSVPRLPAGTTFEVDTPNAAVTFERPGTYRVDVDESGQTRLSVRSGNAILAAGGGQIAVSSGEAIAIEGLDTPRYEILPLPAADRFDGWVESRTVRSPRGPSYQYVSAGVVGAGDLDQYGTWQTVAGYGNVWAPRSVPLGWSPYTVGHWTWQDPWGWTWISTEPWGWAPYHYGRWVTASSRWYWVPVAPAVQTVAYAPALVAFVGGGPGYGATVAVSTGLVGWFPLAPRDPLVPWWGVRPAVNVNVTNVTYVNRTYVTVVNQTTFVSGGPVSAGVIREQSAVRQVASAPVVVGRVPVVPTAASTRVSVRQQAASAPPAAVVSRAVVTRSAPPPAPQRFDQKIATIRESRAPVAAQTASRASATGAAPARPIIPVTSVAAQAGNVRLAPRNASAQTAAKRVEPVAPSAAARSGATARPNEPEPRPGELAARPTNEQRPTPGIAARPPVGAANAVPPPQARRGSEPSEGAARGVPTPRIDERKEEPAAERAPIRPTPGSPSNRPQQVHTPGPPARATSEEGQTRNPRAAPPSETHERASQEPAQQRRAPTAAHPTPVHREPTAGPERAQSEHGQPAQPEARGERAQQPPEPRSETGTAPKPRPTPQRAHGAPEKPTPEPHSD